MVTTMATRSNWRAAASVLFSLIMACLFGLGGFLGGSYLWSRFGPPPNDPDEIDAYFCGLLVGGAIAIAVGVASLWKFWPRTSRRSVSRSLGVRRRAGYSIPFSMTIYSIQSLPLRALHT